MTRPGARSGLGYRFALLVAAAACSGIGNGAVAIAFPLLAASMTRNALLVVGVTISAYLPWLLFGLVGGVIGDRYQPARVVVWVEALRAAVLAGFGIAILANGRSLALVYIVVFLITSGETVFTGTTNAVVPRLVSADQLPHANGILLSAQTASENVIGPAVGGSLFVLLAALPFFVDGLSFVLSGTFAVFALASATRTSHEPTTRPSFRDDLSDGVSAFRESADLPVLLVIVAGFAVAQAMVIGPLVLYATRTLHMSARGFGLMIGISSLGNVVGSLAAGRVVARADPARILRFAGVVIAVSYLVAGLAPNALVATGALSVEAIAVAIGVVAHVSLRQRLIDPAMLGRVGNIFRTATMGLMPIGALLAGLLAQIFGLRAPLIAACILQALVVAFAARRLRPAVNRPLVSSVELPTM